jgi:hypothetical protein
MHRHTDEKGIWFTIKEAGKECPQILFIPKDTLPAVPPADHMVESTRKMNARSTGHTGKIPKNNPCVNTGRVKEWRVTLGIPLAVSTVSSFVPV